MAIPEALLVCLSERLHPVSRMFLELHIQGRITKQDFLWAFHPPNSDYLPVAAGIVNLMQWAGSGRRQCWDKLCIPLALLIYPRVRTIHRR